jgi:uncharacterized membrane protein
LNDTNNVTPLRRPKQKKPVFDVRDPKSQVQLVYGLSVAAFAIMWLGNQFVDWIGMGLGVAALVISASKRDEGVFWARSHFEFTLRTLIIAAVGWTLLSLAGIVIGLIPLIGPLTIFVAKACVLGWVAIRSGFGFLKASDTKVIENPVTWLI